MALTAHVYQIFIKASPEQVWRAVTDSDWTERYFHGTRFHEPPQPGRRYRTHTIDGRPAVDGVIEEMTPPAEGRPGRFVQTWHVLYDAALGAEPPGRVEWTITAAGDGLTRVRLVHGDLAFSPRTWDRVKDGWVWILDGMKTLLETGEPLPEWSDAWSSPSDDVVGDWHRAQGVEANNSAFGLLETAAHDAAAAREAVRSAYAAAYHWDRARGRTPVNESRAEYLIAKVELAAGHPDIALAAADRSLQVCLAHGFTDFDLAYAHEARARALRALGRTDEAAQAWHEATSVPIAGDEDRVILGKDFADYPS